MLHVLQVGLIGGTVGELLKKVRPAVVKCEHISADPAVLNLFFDGRLFQVRNLSRFGMASVLYFARRCGVTKPPRYVVISLMQPGATYHPVILPEEVCYSVKNDRGFYHNNWDELVTVGPGSNLEQTLGVPAEIQYCVWYLGYPADITGLLEDAALVMI